MYAQLILIPIPVPVSILSHATYYRGVHEDELMTITQTKEIRMHHDITSTNDATATARLNFAL